MKETETRDEEEERRYDLNKSYSLGGLVLGTTPLITGGALLFAGVVIQDLETVVAGAGLFAGGGILLNGATKAAYFKTRIEYMNDRYENLESE